MKHLIMLLASTLLMAACSETKSSQLDEFTSHWSIADIHEDVATVSGLQGMVEFATPHIKCKFSPQLAYQWISDSKSLANSKWSLISEGVRQTTLGSSPRKLIITHWILTGEIDIRTTLEK